MYVTRLESLNGEMRMLAKDGVIITSSTGSVSIRSLEEIRFTASKVYIQYSL